MRKTCETTVLALVRQQLDIRVAGLGLDGGGKQGSSVKHSTAAAHPGSPHCHHCAAVAVEELAQAHPHLPLVPQRYSATGLVFLAKDGEAAHPQGSVPVGV